jgi:hypothetical protein
MLIEFETRRSKSRMILIENSKIRFVSDRITAKMHPTYAQSPIDLSTNDSESRRSRWGIRDNRANKLTQANKPAVLFTF